MSKHISQKINRAGEQAELKWLQKNNEKDNFPRTGAVIKMAAEIHAIKQILDVLCKDKDIEFDFED